MGMSELVNDIWKDPNVQAALKDGRRPDDIFVLRCPKCDRLGYYNQGASFHCRFCNKGWRVLAEDEPRPRGVRQSISTSDAITLDDTLTVTTDGYDNQTV